MKIDPMAGLTVMVVIGKWSRIGIKTLLEANSYKFIRIGLGFVAINLFLYDFEIAIAKLLTSDGEEMMFARIVDAHNDASWPPDDARLVINLSTFDVGSGTAMRRLIAEDADKYHGTRWIHRHSYP